MKSIFINMIIFTGALAMSSCNFLDKEPLDFHQPDDYYKTEAQVNSALLGVYAALADNPLYGNAALSKLGLTADVGFADNKNEKGTVAYYDVVAADTKILDYWRTLYRGIGRANMLMKNINVAPMTDKARSEVYAQALFLRAYFHFLLVTRFGDVPLMLAVPASGRLEDVRIAQTPRSEVYIKIIEDMNAAALDLRSAAEESSGTRLTQSAAYGILARVCLNMAGHPVNETAMYEQAKLYAQKVINVGVHRLNPSYQQVFINYIQDKFDIKESIFEVDFYGNGTGIYNGAAGQVGNGNGIATGIDTIGASTGIMRASDWYLKLFEMEDLRRNWTIASFDYTAEGTQKPLEEPGNGWRRCCGKFRRCYELSNTKTSGVTPINFPILRYSDVLLMYAEGVAKSDVSSAEELELAYKYLNQVRRRGYGKPVETVDIDFDYPVEGKDDLFEKIKDERAKELGFELLRKDDIVRWGEFYNRMRYVGQLAISTTGTLVSSFYVSARESYNNVGQRDELWPIPSYELGVNRKLVQNKGW